LPGTPLHERTSALCRSSNWRRWAGYLAAGSYDLYHDREYWAIRNAAGLLDVSPLYKYMIRGPDAVRFLDRLVTRNVRKCRVGRVMYTPWCDGDGKVIDDGTLARLDENVFRLTSADPSLLWFHENAAGMDVSFEDVSGSTAALALQGPNSRKILNSIAVPGIEDLGFFGVMDVQLAGIPVSVSRTGYTGDLGYEIWVDAGQAVRLWDSLTEAGRPYGIVPTGLMALDMARIEAGLVLVTVDYVPTHQALLESQKSTPLELGLAWTVDLGKENFVGRDALARQAATGPEWRLRGLEIDWVSLEQAYGSAGLPPMVPSSAWRTSVPVYGGSGQVGYATSGCWSPLLKKYIALAHLEGAAGALGTRLEMEVTVEHQRLRATATVVETPFFDPPRKRG
jgi:aminomethyltransferase